MFQFEGAPLEPDFELSRPPADLIPLEGAVGHLKPRNDDEGLEDGREAVAEMMQGCGDLISARIPDVLVEDLLGLHHDLDDSLVVRRMVELFEPDQASQFVVENLEKAVHGFSSMAELLKLHWSLGQFTA